MSGKPETYEFKPKINEKSKQIAVKFRKKMLDQNHVLGPDKRKKHKFTFSSRRAVKSPR